MHFFQRIMKKVNSPEVQLLCQISVSGNEYEELLKYTRSKILNLYMQAIPVPDLLLSMALVQIAIHRYDEGNYWDCFLDEIGIDVSAVKRNYLGQIFMKTLRHFNLFIIEQEKGSRQAYVENIKAHAFVPNNYLFGYFDFLFSFYDRNLFRQIPENLEYDIFDMIDFMSDSLSSNSDNVRLEDFGNKPPKIYRLLKATKNVIAQCSPVVICNLISKHLIMIDEYYYDRKLPIKDDRFTSSFIAWCETQESEINIDPIVNRRRKAVGVFYNKPYFEINRSNGQAFLVVPSQKIREDEFSGSVFVEVEYDNKTIKRELDMYRAYGVLVSEQLKINVGNIFTSYRINIISCTTRPFKIPEREYRLFNEDFTELQKLKKGQCYIFTKKGASVKSDLRAVYVNSHHDLWDEYSYSDINEDSVIYINNRPISIAGEFSEEPLFDHVSNEYILYSGERQIQTAYKHPVISFKVAKKALAGTFIWCNNNRFCAKIENVSSIYEFDYDLENCGVSIALSSVLDNKDGLYQIWIDEPGKHRRLICQYVLITSLRCRPEKPRFIFCDKALVHIIGDYDITPLNCERVNDNVYSLDLTSGTEEAIFELLLEGVNYTLIVPLKVFKYGFSRQWKYRRENYLWFPEIENDLFVFMPGATRAFVYLGNEEECIEGEKQSNGEFRFDITDFVNKIRQSSSAFANINLKYFDNKWRYLPIFRVLKRLWLHKFEMVYLNNMVRIISEYEGKAKLKVRISDIATKEIVTEKYLDNGSTDFPELDYNKLYSLEKIQVIPDPFGFSDQSTSLGVIYKIGTIDFSDLTNCKMVIKSIACNGVMLNLDHIYTVYNLTKISDFTYIGKLTFKPKLAINSSKKIRESDVFEKVRFEIMFEEGDVNILSLHALEDGDWTEIWYDVKTNKLISAFDDLLYSSKNYERFIPLYEDITDYNVEFRRVK
ncbi:hypothetical protein [Acetivibrio clariflavus]|uniref:Uncharacterized protein n=1 Tax=Acetivibrio clariflavus (strain DSM 19732 / NBRC 101661 / EBR45) TaxID=720554 RepID=G8LSK9_ACECE|nr:hypothetical protein [Acetivibrio clariflavus]AEV68313.1 hypothetical protein Clocl_1699 [Acetivibrio clariflavus DSM 19732]